MNTLCESSMTRVHTFNVIRGGECHWTWHYSIPAVNAWCGTPTLDAIALFADRIDARGMQRNGAFDAVLRVPIAKFFRQRSPGNAVDREIVDRLQEFTVVTPRLSPARLHRVAHFSAISQSCSVIPVSMSGSLLPVTQ
jgi:hypothetical protein